MTEQVTENGWTKSETIELNVCVPVRFIDRTITLPKLITAELIKIIPRALQLIKGAFRTERNLSIKKSPDAAETSRRVQEPTRRRTMAVARVLRIRFNYSIPIKGLFWIPFGSPQCSSIAGEKWQGLFGKHIVQINGPNHQFPFYPKNIFIIQRINYPSPYFTFSNHFVQVPQKLRKN